MDNFETIVQVVLVVLFVFGQFLFRLFVKGVKGAGKKGTLPAAQPEEEWLEDDDDIIQNEWNTEDSSELGRPAPVKRTELKSTPMGAMGSKVGALRGMTRNSSDSLSKSAALVLESLELQKDRAKTLVTTCSYRNYSVLTSAVEKYVPRLEKLTEQFREKQNAKQVTRALIDEYNQAILLLDCRLSFFDGVVGERATSNAGNFNTVDRVIADMSSYYRQRHPAGASMYRNLVDVAVSSENAEGGGVHGVVLPLDVVTTAKRWSQISAAVAETFITRGQLANKTTSDLGLPAALTSMSYFLTTGKLMSAGLVSSWCKWILSDVAATLQTGIAYANTLLDECEKGGEDTALTHFAIDRRGEVLSMPMLARLISVYAVLKRMDVFELSDVEERVVKVMSHHPEVVIEVQGRGTIPLDINGFSADLGHVAASLTHTPLSGLGQFSLDEIVGTDFNEATLSKIDRAAGLLRRGKKVTFCTPTELVIAVSKAVKKERNAESRVEGAAQKSLAGQLHLKRPGEDSLSILTTCEATCLAHVFSAKHLPNTIMLGAIAKTRGGISR